MPPDVGGATLGAVEDGHAVADAGKRADCAHGHAHFAGVYVQVDQVVVVVHTIKIIFGGLKVKFFKIKFILRRKGA
jgi:hypothetical protein